MNLGVNCRLENLGRMKEGEAFQQDGKREHDRRKDGRSDSKVTSYCEGLMGTAQGWN